MTITIAVLVMAAMLAFHYHLSRQEPRDHGAAQDQTKPTKKD